MPDLRAYSEQPRESLADHLARTGHSTYVRDMTAALLGTPQEPQYYSYTCRACGEEVH